MTGPPRAVCADMPFADTTRLFFPTDDGGQLRRTAAYPNPDTHADARALCAQCALIGPCLAAALREDAHTFRGGMSPEERAVFGGPRSKIARRRAASYLKRPLVIARLVAAGFPIEVVWAVVVAHDGWLREGNLSAEAGVLVGVVGWSTQAPTLPNQGAHPTTGT